MINDHESRKTRHNDHESWDIYTYSIPQDLTFNFYFLSQNFIIKQSNNINKPISSVKSKNQTIDQQKQTKPNKDKKKKIASPPNHGQDLLVDLL